jgi:hypothetical protein
VEKQPRVAMLGPTISSTMPVAKTTVETTTTGAIRRRMSSGGPLRRYSRLPV